MKIEENHAIFETYEDASAALAEAVANYKQQTERCNGLFADLDKLETTEMKPDVRDRTEDAIYAQIRAVKDQRFNCVSPAFMAWQLDSNVGFRSIFPTATPEERERLVKERKALVKELPESRESLEKMY